MTMEPKGLDEPVDSQHAYHDAAAEVIAGGVNSNVRLLNKMCFARASGSRLFGIDGREYIDYALGMGPAILGHAPPMLLERVADSLSLGQMFAGQHPAELELGKLIQQCVPSAERVRFSLTGSEAVQAAIRLARAATGRSKFIKFEGHYHGWYDNVLLSVSAPPHEPTDPKPYPATLQSEGQWSVESDGVFVLPWNDVSAVRDCLQSQGDEVAAVIMEPVMCNNGVIAPRQGYLSEVLTLCREHGAIFILDEVITGFRLGLGGAQGLYGIRPDLSVFAKAVGGGFPLSVLAGRTDLMSRIATGEVNYSGTYNANLPSIIAGIATIQALMHDDGAAYRRIESAGQALMDGLRQLATQHSLSLRVSGFPGVFNTSFGQDRDPVDYWSFKRGDETQLSGFLTRLNAEGIRPTHRGTWFVSAAHSRSDVDETLDAAKRAFDKLSSA